ncbi:unnamed protein product [Sphagnum troendelagicum]|jgi:hypothetical protein
MNWHANTDDGAGSKSLSSQQAGQQEYCVTVEETRTAPTADLICAIQVNFRGGKPMDYLNTQKQVTMAAKNGGKKADIRMVTRHMRKSSGIHIMLLTDLHMSTKNF